MSTKIISKADKSGNRGLSVLSSQKTNTKKYKKAKLLSEAALQIAEKRREAKGKGEKERYTHLKVEFQRIAKRDKAFLVINEKK